MVAHTSHRIGITDSVINVSLHLSHSSTYALTRLMGWQTIASGYITASGRSTADAFYYVINKSEVKGTGTVYLGRPWRNYARVVFQNTVLGSNVIAAGWKVWSDSDTRYVRRPVMCRTEG